MKKRLAMIMATACAVATMFGLVGAPQASASVVAALNRKGVILVSRDTWSSGLAFTAALGHAGIVYNSVSAIDSATSGVKLLYNNWDQFRTRMTRVGSLWPVLRHRTAVARCDGRA